MTPIIAIRPKRGCRATIAAGKRAGLDIAGHPMFKIAPRKWSAPDPARIDAILLGSANAIRHGGAQLELFEEKPVYAVGQITAEVALARGFQIASVGQGGLQSLVDGLPTDPVRFLRLAGADHVSLRYPAHVSSILRVCYASEATPMTPELAQILSGGAVVLIHSAEAARHFTSECERLKVQRSAIMLATLGPRIAAAAGTGWARLECPAKPEDAALVALARQMWQS